jgi:hypothetical protein
LTADRLAVRRRTDANIQTTGNDRALELQEVAALFNAWDSVIERPEAAPPATGRGTIPQSTWCAGAG